MLSYKIITLVPKCSAVIELISHYFIRKKSKAYTSNVTSFLSYFINADPKSITFCIKNLKNGADKLHTQKNKGQGNNRAGFLAGSMYTLCVCGGEGNLILHYATCKLTIHTN